MGQTLSTNAIPDVAPPTKAGTWPLPSPTPLPIHVALSPHNTVVLDIGRLPSGMGEEGQACMWHLQGGLRRYPVPEGYRARCSLYGGIGATLFVEYVAAGHGDERTVRFIMHTDEGTTFTGATPTAPFAKLALSLNRLDVINGMDAFGFNDPKVQALLRHVGLPTGNVDSPPIQCLPDAAASPWASQPGEALEDSTVPLSLKPDILYGMKTYREKQQGFSPVATDAVADATTDAATRRTPSLTPSLQTWLLPSAPKGMSLPAASPKSPPGIEVPAMEHGGTVGTVSRMPRTSGTPVPPSASRWKEPVLTALATEGGVELSGLRPPSRTRRRPASAMGEVKGGRGWTAFTAYGMETRDIVRQENPWATATEVEKLVGRRWAALPPEEKQRYVDLAAEVRRSSQGMYAPIPVDSYLTGGEVNVIGRGEGGGEGGAAEDQRQLRQVRRPKLFGPEFDTSDAFIRNAAVEPNYLHQGEDGQDDDGGAKRRRRGECLILFELGCAYICLRMIHFISSFSGYIEFLIA